jgi:hypothetical protein
MPLRRRLLLLALPTAFVALVVGVWLLWPHPSVITEAKFAKIQPGMTLEEVEAILGGPGRDESNGRAAPMFISSNVAPWMVYPSTNWISDDAAISVVFRNGEVYTWTIATMLIRQERFLDRLRRWLRL